jgi:hypothetical protein
MPERYGAKITVAEWHQRLICSTCGGRDVVVTGTEQR